MKKLLPYIVGIIVVAVLIGGLWFITKPEETQPQTNNTSSSDNSGPGNSEDRENEDEDEQEEAETGQTFTAAQVAEHDSKEDCWTIIRGSVYNITSYIPMYPGGDEILRACGTDATTLFETRTTTDGEAVGSGTGHSSNASSQLSSLKIGTLAN